MPDVFISHSSRDMSLAENLATRLRQFGLSVFLDGISIEPGMQWEETIDQNLSMSSVVLVLVTRSSLASDWVKLEIGGARMQKATIIPILHDMEPKDLPGWLSKYQAVVLTGKTPAEVNEGISALMRQLAAQKMLRAVMLLAIIAVVIIALIFSGKKPTPDQGLLTAAS